MAITTSIMNGLGMGVSVLIILTAANVVISAIRKIVPDKIRIAMFIVVIAGFVTCVDLLLQAFVPAIAEALELAQDAYAGGGGHVGHDLGADACGFRVFDDGHAGDGSFSVHAGVMG